ncbi:MAG: domain containing protein [Marmoricola sp.]|nr:domain containing protein [Marmoricola sp.]
MASARTGTTVTVTTEACSGASTADYWRPRNGRPAQRTWVRKDQDLILLTIGGNDIGFGKVKDSCLLEGGQEQRCAESLSSARKMLDGGTIQTRIEKILADIKKSAAPSAKIVLLGYPFVEGDPSLTFGPLPLGKFLAALGHRTDAVGRAAVAHVNAVDAGRSVIFVSTQDLFSGRSPWLTSKERVRHELFKRKVNTARWMIQPFVDAGAQDENLFYHPNPTGWTREAMLLMQTKTIPTRSHRTGE